MRERRIEVAPLVTVDSAALVDSGTQWQFQVQHTLAGPAVISRCTDPSVDGAFWEVETDFYDETVQVYDEYRDRDGNLSRMLVCDEALSYVSALGIHWAAGRRAGVLVGKIQEMMER